MTMTPEHPDHSAGDALAQAFADARVFTPELRPDLRARIVAQAFASAPEITLAPRPADTGMARLRRWFSGWAMPWLAGGSLAGGALATLAGVWIGASVPLSVAAIDMPLWLDAPLGVIDRVTVHLIGVNDPLWQEF